MKKKDVTAAKRTIKQWHDTHLSEYNEFLKLVDAAIEQGDVTMFEKNFNILEKALPQGVTDYFSVKENNPFLWDSKEITPGKLWDAGIKMREPQMFSMYYWLYFDEGAKTIKTIYTKYLVPEGCGALKKFLYEIWIGLVVSSSVQYYINTKKDWINENKTEADNDAKAVVRETLSQVEGVSQGKSDVDVDLDQMLIGDTEKLIDAIGYFVKNRKKDSHLGYIFHFLQKAECMEKNKYNYTTFHRAIIRQFPDAGISGVDSAQELYGKIQVLKDASTRLLNEYNRMKENMFVRFIEAKQ